MALTPGANAPVPGLDLTLEVHHQGTPPVMLGVDTLALGQDGRPAGIPDVAKLLMRMPDVTSFRLELARPPVAVSRILFVAHVMTPQARIGAFPVIRLRLVTNGPVVLGRIPCEGRRERVMLVAEVYRRQGDWKVRVLGRGFENEARFDAHIQGQAEAPRVVPIRATEPTPAAAPAPEPAAPEAPLVLPLTPVASPVASPVTGLLTSAQEMLRRFWAGDDEPASARPAPQPAPAPVPAAPPSPAPSPSQRPARVTPKPTPADAWELVDPEVARALRALQARREAIEAGMAGAGSRVRVATHALGMISEVEAQLAARPEALKRPELRARFLAAARRVEEATGAMVAQKNAEAEDELLANIEAIEAQLDIHGLEGQPPSRQA